MQQVLTNVHKIWFSTGVFDPEYPPSKILALVKLFEGVRPIHFSERLTPQLKYPGR